VERTLDTRGFRAPVEMIDPGWLFLLAGLAIVACSVLIPAIDELGDVRFQRDRAMKLEAHRVVRLENHERYLAALEREEPALVTSLAATQLNQIPAGRGLVLEPATIFSDPAGSIAASPLAGLEPPALVLPEREKTDSYLQRLTTSNTTRPWVMAGGILCVLIGLLPASRRSAARAG
jgi:hypothetical protein